MGSPFPLITILHRLRIDSSENMKRVQTRVLCIRAKGTNPLTGRLCTIDERKLGQMVLLGYDGPIEYSIKIVHQIKLTIWL